MVRVFSGIQRTQILRSVFQPPLYASTYGKNGTHFITTIVNPGDYSVIELMTPPEFTALNQLLVYFINNNVGAQNIQVRLMAAQPFQAPNNYDSGWITQLLIAPFGGLGTVDAMDLAGVVGLLPIAGLAPEQFIGVELLHAAAGGGGAASNMDVLGGYLSWS